MTDGDNSYEDIINLPYPSSAKRGKMSSYERAAQFSPFAALTGFDDEIEEEGRLTRQKLALDENCTARLNSCISLLKDKAAEHPAVSVEYFLPDEKKSGGAYVMANGFFYRVDEAENALVFTDGTKIPMEDVLSIDGKIFDEFG